MRNSPMYDCVGVCVCAPLFLSLICACSLPEHALGAVVGLSHASLGLTLASSQDQYGGAGRLLLALQTLLYEFIAFSVIMEQ